MKGGCRWNEHVQDENTKTSFDLVYSGYYVEMFSMQIVRKNNFKF